MVLLTHPFVRPPSYLLSCLCVSLQVAVPKSVQAVLCTSPQRLLTNETATAALPLSCVFGLDHDQSYHLFLTAFVLLIGPFAFGNITKTQYLQIFTTVMRYATFFLLIGLCIVGITHPQPFVRPVALDHPPALRDLKKFSLSGLTTMFGVSVYSFMCQHSLPSLIAPIQNQANVSKMLFGVFGVVAMFYYALVYTAIMRFPASVLTNPDHDMYTLVFADYPIKFFSVFLQVFPMFVLSANFPIIAITLRNNLQTLGHKFQTAAPVRAASEEGTGSGAATTRTVSQDAWNQYLYPSLAIGPPIVVAYFTEQVEVLISYTGSYAGVGIQYVIPACACYYGRILAVKELGAGVVATNKHRSYFSSNVWMRLTFAWSFMCIAVVTYNHLCSNSEDNDKETAHLVNPLCSPPLSLFLSLLSLSVE